MWLLKRFPLLRSEIIEKIVEYSTTELLTMVNILPHRSSNYAALGISAHSFGVEFSSCVIALTPLNAAQTTERKARSITL